MHWGLERKKERKEEREKERKEDWLEERFLAVYSVVLLFNKDYRVVVLPTSNYNHY